MPHQCTICERLFARAREYYSHIGHCNNAKNNTVQITNNNETIEHIPQSNFTVTDADIEMNCSPVKSFELFLFQWQLENSISAAAMKQLTCGCLEYQKMHDHSVVYLERYLEQSSQIQTPPPEFITHQGINISTHTIVPYQCFRNSNSILLN